MSQKYFFNIHHLISIEIDDTDGQLIEAALHQLREFVTSETDKQCQFKLIINPRDRYIPSTDVIFESEGYRLYRDDSVEFRSNPLVVRRTSDSLTVYCDTFLVPLNCLVEIALLHCGASFVHAAAVSYQGKGFLFAAHGGVGKTLLIADALEQGAKLLGDDLVILHNGCIYSYPIDFSVYPYHASVLPLARATNYGTLKCASYSERVMKLNPFKGRSQIAARIYSFVVTKLIGQVCVNVPPRELFGDCFISNVIANKIVLLKRAEVNQVTASIAATDRLTSFMVTVLLNEWHATTKYFLGYLSMLSHDLTTIISHIESIIRQQVQDIGCVEVSIPTNSKRLKFIEIHKAITELEYNLVATANAKSALNE